MEPIICENSAETLALKLQEYLKRGGIIASLAVVDATGDQIVLLVNDEPISQQMAEIFWQGWQAALG